MKNLNVNFLTFAIVSIFAVTAGMSILSAEQNLLQTKCTKCHGLKVPGNYTAEKWKYNVERMAQRAGLTPGEIQSLINLNKKK